MSSSTHSHVRRPRDSGCGPGTPELTSDPGIAGTDSDPGIPGRLIGPPSMITEANSMRGARSR